MSEYIDPTKAIIYQTTNSVRRSFNSTTFVSVDYSGYNHISLEWTNYITTMVAQGDISITVSPNTTIYLTNRCFSKDFPVRLNFNNGSSMLIPLVTCPAGGDGGIGHAIYRIDCEGNAIEMARWKSETDWLYMVHSENCNTASLSLRRAKHSYVSHDTTTTSTIWGWPGQMVYIHQNANTAVVKVGLNSGYGSADSTEELTLSGGGKAIAYVSLDGCKWLYTS